MFLERLANVKSITIGPAGSRFKRRHTESRAESLVWSSTGECTVSAYKNICLNLEQISLRALAVDPRILQSMVESRLVLNEEDTQRSQTPTSTSPARLRTVRLEGVQFTGKSRDQETMSECSRS